MTLFITPPTATAPPLTPRVVRDRFQRFYSDVNLNFIDTEPRAEHFKKIIKTIDQVYTVLLSKGQDLSPLQNIDLDSDYPAFKKAILARLEYWSVNKLAGVEWDDALDAMLPTHEEILVLKFLSPDDKHCREVVNYLQFASPHLLEPVPLPAGSIPDDLRLISEREYAREFRKTSGMAKPDHGRVLFITVGQFARESANLVPKPAHNGCSCDLPTDEEDWEFHRVMEAEAFIKDVDELSR